MKILVIGSGAREHAIVWKISKSDKVSNIYCAPGNGGIRDLAECVDIKPENIEGLLNFVKEKDIDMTVVGPEVPLVKGIVDRFEEEDLKIFGPNKACSLLEGSKIYAKNFMEKYSIPTAKYETYSDFNSALKGLEDFNYPLVIKADGLAAGKGVLICDKKEDAVLGLENMMKNKKFGESGSNIVIEEFLDGIELSLLCFVSNNKIIPMESAKDYKKAFDGDEGLNTGGMGCFSPNIIFKREILEEIKRDVINNIENGLNSEGLNYNGVLFIGFMITENGPKVLEFNVRMGDPETEVVLPRLESDIIDIFTKTLDEELTSDDLKWSDKKSMCVILASGGYPEKYEKGKTIAGLDNVDDDIIVFHAGTKYEDGDIVTNGGRVMAVTTLGENLDDVRKKVYDNIEKINYDKKFYRTDIGKVKIKNRE
ncbi:phosphoribosylamine--glycine ligase [Dethiothermospora halolimnae]|uniref:phosphoribosylamine--glycine ligase n=1 Tax=Dethiothermospora halolimnae TaxID=3114390 RepID=UPI003CCBA93D